jgi:HlyD family secretion protein
MDKSQSDAKRANANRLAAESRVKVARSELDRARAALREFGAGTSVSMSNITIVHSPVSGRILKIHKKSEGAVISGEPLVDIGNPNKLEVEIEVLSEYAVKIKQGMPVLFERWGGEQILSGKVRIVEPAGFTKISSLGVEEQRAFVIADIISMPESWQRLGDGYRVEARFIIWEGKDVLQVPASSIFRKGDKWALFSVKNNRAVERQVEIGQRTGLTVEILSGISEGDIVIAYPDESIKERTRIKQK